jgi:hypothetical protein
MRLSGFVESLRGEQGSALVITVLLVTLLLALGSGLLVTATVESAIAVNESNAEGAFYAAEAAVQATIDQLAQDNVTFTLDELELSDGFSCRSGGVDDAGATPPLLVGSFGAAGYDIGLGNGYSGGSQFVFEIYQVNGTGMGPRNARREIEVQVAVGPRPN